MESIIEEASIGWRGLVARELDADPEERSIQIRNFDDRKHFDGIGLSWFVDIDKLPRLQFPRIGLLTSVLEMSLGHSNSCGLQRRVHDMRITLLHAEGYIHSTDERTKAEGVFFQGNRGSSGATTMR